MFRYFRRWLAAALLAVAILAAAIVPPVVLAQSEAKEPFQFTLTGHISADSTQQDYVYTDFEVPEGTTSIYVVQKYSQKGAGNLVDLGCWDQRGHELALSGNYTTGFRGWSGRSRSEFTISPTAATPGYIPGPIEPGHWSVVQFPYEMVSDGIDYELDIELRFDPVTSYFEPSFAPSRVLDDTALHVQEGGSFVVQSDPQWYRGDFHVHTTWSDGLGTPDMAVDLAQKNNLSFFFSTEHNTQSLDLVWGTIAPTGMLIARGIEVTTQGGHWNAFGLSWDQWVEFRYGEDEPRLDAIENLHRQDGFAGVNHPFDTNCRHCDWNFSYEGMDSIEVWNGPWRDINQQAIDTWQEMLINGSRITGLGGSDYHGSGREVGIPTTLVRASSLSTSAIVRSLRGSRVGIVRDGTIDFEFTVRSQVDEVTHVGDTVGRRSKDHGPLLAVFKTRGMPEGAKAIVINENGELDEEDMLEQNLQQDCCEVEIQIDEESRFIRAEVRDASGSMLGMTNPIWM